MVRLVLIFLIIFLIVRMFVVYGSGETSGNNSRVSEDKSPKSRKGVPKGIGEYVDYEEVNKK